MHCNGYSATHENVDLAFSQGGQAFRTTAESDLHDGKCLTRFIEATVRPAVEHRHMQAAFEARTKESLAQCKRSRMASSSGEVFGKLEARRKQVFGR